MSPTLGPILMYLFAFVLGLFLLLYAGRVLVVACQLHVDAQCVVQELVLGVYEVGREQIVGAHRVEVVQHTYDYSDDDGSTRTGYEQRLTFFDPAGGELGSRTLSSKRVERNASIWAAELERALAQGSDGLPRFWFANISALFVGTLLWVGFSSGLLGKVLGNGRGAAVVVLGLGLLQALLLSVLMILLYARSEPPADWPGLASPVRLPNLEH